MNDVTISLESLYYIRELGCGAYGKVYLVHDQRRFYAMKTAEIQAMSEKKEMAQMYINEKSIMSSISHPFVVQLHNTFKTREYIFFLWNMLTGSHCGRFLNKNKKMSLEIFLRFCYTVRFYFKFLITFRKIELFTETSNRIIC